MDVRREGEFRTTLKTPSEFPKAITMAVDALVFSGMKQ